MQVSSTDTMIGGEVKVKMRRADGPRVAKGGREAWTEGPEARGSAVVAGSL